jgi:hypothetical protein
MSVDLLNAEEVRHATSFVARIARANDTVWLDKPSFIRFLKDQDLTPSVVLEGLAKHLGAQNRKARMGGGTNKTSAINRMIEISTAAGPLKGFYDQ